MYLKLIKIPDGKVDEFNSSDLEKPPIQIAPLQGPMCDIETRVVIRPKVLDNPASVEAVSRQTGKSIDGVMMPRRITDWASF